ncbi:GNAT family N-acetyltransferase [Mesoterricola silvestris]|uniref:N-acetyltransferase domain-containing protein n=1 Tax=Mesoterricola silvestris TaxID=2927979 RepID=A0AA48GRE3_9BACT|nr:GNAT family N-acetyltransferase [Mesoterricola silvestris]BDU72840.1 hypothetical protein METEAL_20140 [Mesoterricola silvestris]
MTGGLSILPLQAGADAEACAALLASSEPWRTLGLGQAALLAQIQDPGRERYVARMGDRLAGYLALTLQGAFVGYVQTICVAPGFRNLGLGAELIAFAEARIFRDHPNVFLCVSAFNHGARRFYARLGYAAVGELTDYLIAGQSEILMRKTRGPKLP